MKLCHFIFSLMKSVPVAVVPLRRANASVSLSLGSRIGCLYIMYTAETLVGGGGRRVAKLLTLWFNLDKLVQSAVEVPI
jgi:hypothetical protein